MKYVFVIGLFILLNLKLIGQTNRFIGLVGGYLVEVNPFVPDLKLISKVDFPQGTLGGDMAYSYETCLFYTIIHHRDNPQLVSFDFFGNSNIIGEFKGSGFEIFVIESLAIDPENNKLYASGSLDGLDFYAQTLFEVNPENAICQKVTDIIYSNPYNGDIDNMCIHNKVLYFSDGQPGSLDRTDLYKFDLNNLGSQITIDYYYSTSYIASSDLVFFENQLFLPAQDHRLMSLDPTNPIIENLGLTHTNAYNGDRILGLEYIIDYTNFDYNQSLGPDLTICAITSLELNNIGYDVTWNTGETSSSIAIDSDGTYSAVINHNNCPIFYTDTVSVIFEELSTNYLQFSTCESSSIEINNVIYDQAGTYVQNLVDSNGCDSILNIEIVSNEVYIPNVFTPDIEPNHLFRPYTKCSFDNYMLSIYDRWGNLVFSTDDYSKAWDGSYIESESMQGVYAYEIKFGNSGEFQLVKTGSVVLID